MSKRGDKTGQRIRNSILDLHLQIKKENKNKTRQELGEDERFEDHPHADRDKDIGRVKRISTSTIQNRNRGD
jgi:hypothetical protein|tara:strand:+ start:477 stop:692 length:216 start_codon:yes stop_codon:yes gene_type:complete